MKNKGMYRLLSGVLCTSVLLSSQAYAAASADYSDMPQNWSKEAMEFAVKNNFITGVGENKIAPKAALTRAQLAAILSRAMQTGAGDVSVLDNFTDADKNAWYAGAMAKAVELNILYGDGDSIYPDRPVTRQELFTILVRAFSVTGGDESTLASYNDAGSISSWAKAAISAMIAQGYAAGYEDKTLRPAQQVTREEFAQLLHRMREHYSSSDTSEDKTETKTDDTAKTDETTKTNTKKPSGGGGGSSSGGGSHSSGGSVTVKKIVDETKATVQSTDMGTWLPLVFTDSYTFDTVASVKVGDMDVTAALSKVTTDGTIAKLALTGKPDKVMITAKDGKTQTITLNGTDGAAAVYTGTQYLPQRVLTHGAVAIWDYHLTNYDTDGNIRTEPKTTTFDLNKSVNARAFYSPDAELKEGEGFGKVSGEVIIKFNYNTAEEKAWFDGINTLQLAGYSERLESLNNNLEFNTKVGTSKYGHYGQLTIELGQPNFFSNGRYYVRVKSKAGETVLVPIHVVNEKAPSMELTEMPESGKNLHFNVKDMTYGITNPIESVTLTDPNGKTEKLTYIEDYYLFGDTFVLYNDKENHLSYKGNYKLTISSNGFQTFETKFNVREGEEAEKTVVYQYAANDVDVVTHATGGSSSGGSSEDGGGSNTMPANLVFDTDLLANALLLHKMERTTADVEKIVNYWRYDINGRDSVFDKGATDYYKYSSYITAVNTAQTGNASWLSYEDYLNDVSEDAKNPNRPYAVKAILEDGLLGETQYNGDYGKLTAPDFMVGDAAEGRPVVLTTENKAYVGEIKGLYLNGDWRMLREDAYEIDKAAGTITIKAGVLKVGENTISIVATGYQKKTIAINNNKMKETDLTLSVNKESFKQGETATLTVNGSKGDFLKNLTGVALMKDGKVVKNVLYKGAEGSEAAYYEIDKTAADGNVLKLTLTAQEVEAGDYTVSLTANYYEEKPLTVGFKVTAKDDSGEVTLTAPTVVKAELTEQSGLFEYCDYYRLRFGTISGTDLTAYLNKVTGVTVNGVTYTKESTYMKENTFRVKAEEDTYSTSAYDVLDLAAKGVDTTKNIEIVITAEGYAEVKFTIENTSGGGGTTNPTPNPGEGKLDAPAYTIQSATETGTYGSYNYYGVTFDGDTAASYVKAITGVTVATANGTETYTKSSTGYAEGNTYVLGGFMASKVLKLGEGGFDKNGKTTVTIKADGYKNLVINYGTDVTPPTKPESPEAKTAPTGTVAKENEYYQVSFAGDDAFEYIKAIKSVKVGDVSYVLSDEYTPTNNQFAKGSVITPVLKLGSAGFTGSGDITITITADGYAENTVKYTMSDKDDNNAPDNDTMKVSECVKNRYGRYYLKFDGLDIRNFNITEVKVGENTYEELSLIWGNSKYSKAESEGQGIDCLELSANGFNASGETEIIIKGTVDGKEVTITYRFPAK